MSEKTDYILSILLLRTLLKIDLCWDHFLGRRRTEDVFAFHEFSIFFDSVFCKMPEIKIIKGISKRMALVLHGADSAGAK